MKQTDRPNDSQECARERCTHPFGLHFIAHDGHTIGCAWSFDDQRDGYSSCQCDGFLISYVYPTSREV